VSGSAGDVLDPQALVQVLAAVCHKCPTIVTLQVLPGAMLLPECLDLAAVQLCSQVLALESPAEVGEVVNTEEQVPTGEKMMVPSEVCHCC